MALEPEKRERIINAALQEFAEQGYQDASTNRIVKAAGIGKGMLFYYFKSKRDLFLYLIEYSLEYIEQDYLSQLDNSSGDYIERLRQSTKVKLRALGKNPYVFAFGGSLHLSGGADVPPDIMARIVETQRSAHLARLADLDTSLFRDGIPPEMTIKLVQWAVEGYERELSAKLKATQVTNSLHRVDYGPFIADFYVFLDVLKNVFYKEEVAL